MIAFNVSVSPLSRCSRFTSVLMNVSRVFTFRVLGYFPRVLLVPEVSRAATNPIKEQNNLCSPEKHISARLLLIDVNKTLTTATLTCGSDSCQMSELYKLKSASNVTASWPERDALLLSALA